MKPSELRVGNLYLSTKFNVPVVCEVSDFNQIYHLADGATPDETDVAQVFKPLELSNEALERLGFEYSSGYWRHDDSLILLDDDYRLTTSNDDILSTPFEYIHEIQDLHFILTREQLKCEPSK